MPTPSLKYRLTPDPRTLRPGNAATLYYRTLAMFVENQNLLKELRQEHWYEWPSTPLAEFPLEQAKAGVHQTRYFIQELAQAARLRDCDWYLDHREEGIGLLLTEFRGDLLPPPGAYDKGLAPDSGKGLGPGTQLEELSVNGGRGYWIEGWPHLYFYRDAAGQVRQGTTRLVGNRAAAR